MIYFTNFVRELTSGPSPTVTAWSLRRHGGGEGRLRDAVANLRRPAPPSQPSVAAVPSNDDGRGKENTPSGKKGRGKGGDRRAPRPFATPVHHFTTFSEKGCTNDGDTQAYIWLIVYLGASCVKARTKRMGRMLEEVGEGETVGVPLWKLPRAQHVRRGKAIRRLRFVLILSRIRSSFEDERFSCVLKSKGRLGVILTRTGQWSNFEGRQ